MSVLMVNFLITACSAIQIKVPAPFSVGDSLKLLKEGCGIDCLPGIITSNSVSTRELTSNIVQNYIDKPLVLIDAEKSAFFLKVTMAIAVIEDTTALNVTLKTLKQNAYFNVQDKVVVIVTQPIDATQIESSLKKMWEEANLLNCIVVYFDNRTKIMSFNPFLHGGSFFSHNTSLHSTTFFPDKLKNMHGHVFKVSLFELLPRYAFKNGHYFGPDVNLLHRILSRINAKYKVAEPRGKRLNEDSANEDVFSGRTDFSLLRVFISNLSRHNHLQYTYPHKMDDVVVVIPKGSRAPNSSYIIKTFKGWIWLLSIIALFLLIIVLMIEKKIVGWLFGFEDHTDAYFEIIRVFLNGGTPNFFRASTSKKFIFLSCMRLSMLVAVYLQCTLASSLLTINYLKDIDTINQLQKTTMKIMVPEYFRDIIPKELNLHHRFIYTSKQQMWQHLMQMTGDVAYIMTYSSAKLINKLAKLKWDKKVYHTNKEHLVPGYCCYVFPRNTPYLNKINKLVSKDIEDGFVFGIQYELNDLNAVMNLTASKEMEPDFNIQKSPIVLTLSHLEPVFVALLIGYAISLCVFAFEVNWPRMRKILRVHERKRRH